jgi:hypothetical protein
MRKVVWWMLGCLLLANICGCNGKAGDQPPQGSKAEQKVNPTEAGSNGELALKFLQGGQKGDKKGMYQAANLTTELVNESRENLIHKQKDLTEQQSLSYQHALRVSGDIDFFIAKLPKLLPKSSSIKITRTAAKDVDGEVKQSVHTVMVTYGDRMEAMRDKTGKPIKELILHLQQTDRLVGARRIREFSFDSKDFDRMADRDFEVVSYF